MADFADNIRFADYAGYSSIGIAHDHEIGVRFSQKLRRVDEWSFVSESDELFARCGQNSLYAHQSTSNGR